MTKTTLLTAASVVAVLFAGAATAGEISGTVAGKAFDATPAKTYIVASETKLTTALQTAAAGFVATNDLDQDLLVVAGTTQNYTIKFELANGTFPTGATVTPVANNAAGVPIAAGVTFAAAGRTATSVTYVATVTATGADITIGSFGIAGQVSVAAAKAVTIKGSVDLLAGGSTFPVDSAPAVTAIDFKPLLTGLTATAYTAVAALPDFELFKQTSTATANLSNWDGGDYRTAELANGFSAYNAGTFYQTLTGTTVSIGDIFDADSVVTVTGPQALTANLSADLGLGATATYAAGAASFKLTAVQAADFVDDEAALRISQTSTVADREALSAGGYTIAWKPVLKAAFTAPSTTSAAAGSVSLDGVNFIAPWVSGSGLATSVIRLGNAGGVSGPVTVRLRSAVKVVGGVSTPVTSSVVYAAGTIPAGGDLQISSAQLVAAFGDFTRGDFQVTIQSSSAPLTAKLRNTRDGVSFEQSLGSSLNEQ